MLDQVHEEDVEALLLAGVEVHVHVRVRQLCDQRPRRISRPEDVELLLDAGVDAVLVGESLLRAADPGAKLRSLIAAGAPQSVGRRGR